MPTIADQEWFRAYYGEDYGESVRDLLTPERTRGEVDFIVQATGLAWRARIADLGCGEGRHALEFAHRGHSVTAIDLNRTYLQRGRERAQSSETVQWICADMREPQPGPFDLVLLLFHSFGFFSDEENARLLRVWRTETAPRGHVLIDVWNTERILRDFAPHAVRTAPSVTTVEERSWDPGTRRLNVHYTYRQAGAPTRAYDTSFRLYSRDELWDLLLQAGYVPQGVYGSLRGDAWNAEATRCVVVARG